MSSFATKTRSASLLSVLLPLAAGSVLLLTACGKKAEPTPVEITANDQMQYSTKSIEVPAGSEAVIILKNIGTIAKEIMGHNLTILKPGTDVGGYGAKAMAAKDTDFQPQSEAASVVIHSRLLGPGESDTLRVTLAAGEYPFLCTFPGHFAVMQGVVTAR